MAKALDKKKVVKKDAAKSNLSPAEELAAKRADLLTAQKGLYDGTLQNPHAIKYLKKDIARLLTKINQKEGK